MAEEHKIHANKVGDQLVVATRLIVTCTLASTPMVHSQEIEQRYFNINKRLASQHAKLIEMMHLVLLHERERERESERERERERKRGSANAYVCSIFAYSIGHLPR